MKTRNLLAAMSMLLLLASSAAGQIVSGVMTVTVAELH